MLMSQIVVSYFLGSEPTRVSSFLRRDEAVEKQRWTLPVLPGRRLDRQASQPLLGTQGRLSKISSSGIPQFPPQ